MSHDKHLWKDFRQAPWEHSNRRAAICSFQRAMISLQKGYMGLAPGTTRVGDVIAILGGMVPYVLRPKEDGTYSLLGECYVHGSWTGGHEAG